MQQSRTLTFYSQLDRAYRHFNEALFGGELDECLLTLRSSDRHSGYHHKDRFISKDGSLLSELGLNPSAFTHRPIEYALSTLVHEMVHHWQSQHGNDTPSNAHNKEWAEKMQEVGLMPSDTGLPGGKQTGQTMTHYVMPEGQFIVACKQLVDEGFEFGWYDRYTPRSAQSYQKQVDQLDKEGVRVPLSESPVKMLPEPKLSEKEVEKLEQKAAKKGLDEPSMPPAVFSPPPKRESNRIRQFCSTCSYSVWAGKDVDLICGTCSSELQK